MKILYLLEQFPKKTSEAFILNEIIELEKLGHKVYVLADWINQEAAIDPHQLIVDNNFMNQVIEVDGYTRGLFKLKEVIKRFIIRSLSSPLKNIFYLKQAFTPLVGDNSKRDKFNFWAALDNYLILDKISFLDFELVYSPFAPVEKIRRGLLISRACQIPFINAFRAQELYRDKYQKNIIKYRWLYNQVDGFVTISQYNKDYLLHQLEFNKPVEVIHSAIDPEKFKRQTKTVSTSELRITTVARFVEKKGLTYLFKALKIVKDFGLKFKLTLVGRGPLRAEYDREISKLGLEEVVKIIGPMNQEKVKDILEKTDIFILPCIIADNGDRDILANVLKEAMAMEVPVITSNIAGIRELINDRKEGLLTSPKDSQALAEAITELSGNKLLQSIITKAGRKKIKQEFNVSLEANKLSKFFYHIIYQKIDL